MTQRILIANNSDLDIMRLTRAATELGLMFELCASGEELASLLDSKQLAWGAIVILLDLPGPPFGLELLTRCRHLLPGVPLIVVANSLDASLAARAHKLGASDVLQSPLDPPRVKSCFNKLFKSQDSHLPMIEELNKRILGKSSALLSTLRQLAKVIHHRANRILLIGDSGTGKELLAQALHDFSPDPNAPFIAVNVAAIPKELSESELFGHEKGAFTGATSMHRGFMEAAENGTLFFDELGELELAVQAKLLRAIQEKKFRRLKGTKEIEFRARLVCATNKDLAADVEKGTFRRDLFHRVAEVTIQVPPLRERKGDIDLLLRHFLKVHAANRNVQLARETLSVLHSYPFPGNVRELENFVKMALIECDEDSILPHHLPLPTISAFLKDHQTDRDHDHDKSPQSIKELSTLKEYGEPQYDQGYESLFREVLKSLPRDWVDQPYKKMVALYQQAFDRIYLPILLERHNFNVTGAAEEADFDRKTLKQHWDNSGLEPLNRRRTTQKKEQMVRITDD
jgi:DNA-binding NtrC family response regulator